MNTRVLYNGCYIRAYIKGVNKRVALKRLCTKCGNKIDVGERCTECEATKSRLYDTDRPIEITKFYRSNKWRELSKYVRDYYMNIDLYIYHTEHRVVPSDMVHHITSVREDFDKRFEFNNLIPLSSATHNMIEQMYARGGDETLLIKGVLYKIIKKYSGGGFYFK